MGCTASDNAVDVDQSTFWDPNGIHWDAHKIGWTIAGSCALLTVLISAITVVQHFRNYTNRSQQRQIIRILYMPPVYAIISFFSYRFFRDYTYYSLIEVVYEAVTISAFLLLLIDYVASTATGHSAEKAIARKDKRPLPFPFCCWRYRPTKVYFMYTVKWFVLQYVIIRPAVSIAGIIAQSYDVLCEAGGFNWRFASVWLSAIDFISISVALYGLLMFYGLTADELKNRRPLAKFLSIKLIVMFTFYQSFVFSALEGRVIKATRYWTATNIADGLNALTICIEMVFFAILMWWAYTPAEYHREEGALATSIWRPLWDSINYADFALEIIDSFKFFIDYVLGKPSAHGQRSEEEEDSQGPPRKNFAEAFGISSTRAPSEVPNSEEYITLDPKSSDREFTAL
ncbi:uncharacterized protein LACBIDRAFT_295223 [Laccaria bicolor S238N-H82]|uniref:Predicted protein n=1 Tax=Laccaria bicolor (strain S238N-H82 / ATCC MYA-4686) TaxID=486041 RepID=B0DPJ9_LACBS|nr:uncharacterized protein LACBIDRAFT_295223 [Laccaria bicolor S238N-H82]EDR03464.1 predicted protein [Laccaria bicolor S238N-H82]|eukprot:XP_001885920.1 predicted protein [Laccaria bicolor S238N-H82]